MAAAAAERLDTLFLNVAQQAGSIEKVLDHFFGFLQRKTDFFLMQDSKASRELVLKYYDKNFQEWLTRNIEIEQKKRSAEEERKQKMESAEEKRKKDEDEYKQKQEDIARRAAEATANPGPEVEDMVANWPDPNEGNGGTNDKYMWIQTLAALEIFVDVPPGTQAKEVVCDFTADTLKVGLKGQPLITDGKLYAKIRPDDSTWTLVDNKVVHISMEKIENQKWWAWVVQGDAKINTKKIDGRLGHLDNSTRNVVAGMMKQKAGF